MLSSKGCYILHIVHWSLIDLFVIVGLDLYGLQFCSQLAGAYIYVSQQMKFCDRGLRLLHCFNCIIVKRGRGGYKVTAIKNLHEVQQTIGIHQTVQEMNRSEQEAKRIVHETNRTVREAYNVP